MKTTSKFLWIIGSCIVLISVFSVYENRHLLPNAFVLPKSQQILLELLAAARDHNTQDLYRLTNEDQACIDLSKEAFERLSKDLHGTTVDQVGLYGVTTIYRKSADERISANIVISNAAGELTGIVITTTHFLWGKRYLCGAAP